MYDEIPCCSPGRSLQAILPHSRKSFVNIIRCIDCFPAFLIPHLYSCTDAYQDDILAEICIGAEALRDEETALRTFERYKKCTDCYCRRLQEGCSLTDLTVAV